MGIGDGGGGSILCGGGARSEREKGEKRWKREKFSFMR